MATATNAAMFGDVLGSDSACDDIFIGRQPIYDRQLQVVAYELLFRSGQTNAAKFTDGDQATLQIMLNALVEFGLQHIVADKKAFVNLTYDFFTGKLPIPSKCDQLVLEVLENIPIDDALVTGVEWLSDIGFTIALDDVVYHDGLKPLLEHAKIVKVELPAIAPQDLARHVEMLKRYPVQLLAEKVETQEEFERCNQLGFDLFQGYFLARPNVVSGRKIPNNKLTLLRLMAVLEDPRVTMAEIEKIIRQDVTLSYKLMRYINSSHFSLPNKIDSLQTVLALLGMEQTRRLVRLISMSRMSDKPHSLMMTALARGRMCELLSQDLPRLEPSCCFTTGLFSALDAMLDQPMAEVLQYLPLADDVKQALLHRTGPLGGLIDCVLGYEIAAWDKVVLKGIDPSAIRDAYFESLSWAQEVLLMLIMD